MIFCKDNNFELVNFFFKSICESVMCQILSFQCGYNVIRRQRVYFFLIKRMWFFKQEWKLCVWYVMSFLIDGVVFFLLEREALCLLSKCKYYRCLEEWVVFVFGKFMFISLYVNKWRLLLQILYIGENVCQIKLWIFVFFKGGQIGDREESR